MKKIIFFPIIFLLSISIAEAQKTIALPDYQGTKLEVIGDTTVILTEGNQRIAIDSVFLERGIQSVKKDIKTVDDALLKIEAKKAEILEEKSKKQTTLTYFLEVRNKYWALKKHLKNKSR